MKLNKLRVMQLLLCSVALVMLLTFFSIRADNQLIVDSANTIFLLRILFILLGMDLLLVLIKEEVATKGKLERVKSGEGRRFLVEGITNAFNRPWYHPSKIGLKVTIMGILLLLAAQLNICVFFLLLGLIPIDILRYKMLYVELVRRSRNLHKQISGGWQEISAADMVEDTPTLKRIYKTLVSENTFSPAGSRILQLTSAVARTIIIVLAVCDFITQAFNPLFLGLYCIILPLFFSSLSEVVNGNLSTLDLINSIHYVDKITTKLKNNGDQD